MKQRFLLNSCVSAMRAPAPIVAFLLATIPAMGFVMADGITATVLQPSRAVAYTIGDVLEQQIVLKPPNIGQTLISLPLPKREGQWVERISSELSNDQDRIILEYQIINAPLKTQFVSLPALQLDLSDGQTISVEPWRFSVSPQIPADIGDQSELEMMLPDISPDLPDTRFASRNLKLSLVALAGTLLSWLAWWLWQNGHDSRNLPCNRAYKALRRLNAPSLVDEDKAWLALHRAFDDSAGYSVSLGSLNHTLQELRWLEPMRAQIHEFYEFSTQRFFGHSAEAASFDLLSFCNGLRKLEKDHFSGVQTTPRKANNR